MLKRIAAVFTALMLAVGLSVASASGAQAAVTNAGKFYNSSLSQSAIYVKASSNTVYSVAPGQYSYNVIPDVNYFMVPAWCRIVIAGAQYQGGGWEPLSNALSVRNARVYC